VRRARRPIGVVVVRQQHQPLRHRLRECGNPISRAGNVGSGEQSAGHSRANRRVKRAPLRQIRVDVVAGGAHCGPATKSVRFISDLEGQQICAHDVRHVCRLIGCFGRRAARKVQSVNELPSQHAQGRGQPIYIRWPDHEAGRPSRLRIGTPEGAFTRVAADAYDAVLAERLDQPKCGGVARCEVIATGQDRGFVAEPDEIQGDRLPRVLGGDCKAQVDTRLTSIGAGRK
jgi:hypothetical protein